MGESAPKRRSFLASARLVGLCTLLSRVLGMVRDVLTAKVFGAGMLMDAFGIAYLVPNLFRRLFGEGALTASFVPTFVARLEQGKPADANALLNRLMTRLMGFLGLVVLLGVGITFVLPMVTSDDKALHIARMTRIMLPYLVFICGAAVLGGALNSLRHFFAPAFAPVLLNLVWIAAILLSRDLVTVCWAIVAGGLLQMVVMFPPLRRHGMRPAVDTASDEGLKEVWGRFLPMVLGLALVQVNELVGRIIAETCIPGHGGVSALYYGNQLHQLPLALIGASVATTVFPAMTSAVAGGRGDEFSALFQKALRATLYIAIPAAVGGILFARPIIRLIFERGAFDAEATTRASGVLACYFASLWCYCANQVQVRAFYAHGDTGTPVKVSVAMMILSLALNLVLVWPLAERGIAITTSISGLGSFLLLNILLRRRHGPSLALGPVWTAMALSFAASAVMAAAAWGGWTALQRVFPGDTLLHQAGRLLPAIAGGGLIYLAATWLFGMKEARALTARR